MSKEVEVSIVLPTYNRGNIIGESINSIISQKFKSWELIIADDNSTDDTEKVCQEFQRDSRIKYFKNEKNLGLPRNRNEAIKKASGKFILFTEDDMILDNKCLEILVDTYYNLHDENIGAICSSIIMSIEYDNNQRGILNFAKDSNDINLEKTPSYIDKKTGLMYRNFSPEFKDIIIVDDCHSCSLYPKHIFNKFKYEENAYKGNYIGEESELHFKLRKEGYNLYFQPKAIMFHNVQQRGGCRLPLMKWAYYFVRNHSVFLFRNYGVNSVLMIISFYIYILTNILKYYFVQIRSQM